MRCHKSSWLHSPNDAHRDRFLHRVDEALRPFILDQGWDLEYSVIETRRDLWKINGMVPPGNSTEVSCFHV
jgi:hypothetical protein